MRLLRGHSGIGRLAILAIVISLSGCGSKPDGATETDPQDTAQSEDGEANPQPEPDPAEVGNRQSDDAAPGDAGIGLQLSVVDREDLSSAVHVETVDVSSQAIYVLVSNRTERSIRGPLTVEVVAVPGTPAGAAVEDRFVTLAAGEDRIFPLSVQDKELQPGTYDVTMRSNIDLGASTSFFVDVPNMAEFLSRENAPAGPNIALAALGGEVVSVSDSYQDRSWTPSFLIDGFAQIYGIRYANVSDGWQARNTTSAEIVVAFNGRETATIDALGLAVVETTASARTLAGFRRASPIPKNIEIWVADAENEAAFVKVAEARIYRSDVPQLVRFAPTDARFVKLRIVDNHGANQVALAELMVFESRDASPSILDTMDINVALPALGGYVVSASTAKDGNEPWQLIDGTSSGASGWLSDASGKRPANYTPQDLVFGFGNSDTVFIDHLEIDPLSGPAFGVGDFSAYQAKELSIGTAATSEAEWEEIGQLTMPKDNSRHTVEIGREAARIRVRVLSNHGGNASALGEVRIIEGKTPGYRSIALGADRWFGPPPRNDAVASNVDDAVTATPPGLRSLDDGVTRTGRFENTGQVDQYRVTVSTASTAALTLRLTGSPSVRTAIRLLDDRGSMVKSFVPSATAGTEAALSWLVAPGPYTIEVSETPVSQVVAFDTSGSMGARIRDLEQAVRAYVAGAREDEFINLVQFSEKVKPVLDDFSTDTSGILAALDGLFESDGSTSLVDAIYQSAEMLMPRQGRQVIVSFTDGQDTSSATTRETLSGLLTALPIQVYTIGLGDSLTSFNRRTASTGHQFLSNVSQAGSYGRYFAVSDSNDIAVSFDAIGRELRAPSDYTIAANVSDAKGELRVSTTGEMIPGLAPPRFELILDASGSMKRASGGSSRMAIARQVLKSVLEQVPDNTEVALRVFGHRTPEGQQGDCEDSELLVPFGSGQKSRIVDAIGGVAALGTTPIAYSVEKAIEDMQTDEDTDTVVILVTDGEEECREDLADVVKKARDSGTRFSMNIVGFELDEATTADMASVAELAAGGFFSAGTSDELGDAMIKVLSAPYAVLDGSGDVVTTGVINGDPVSLYAGTYSIAVNASGVSLNLPDVNVPPNGVRSLQLNRQGDSVGVYGQLLK